jgi:Zn-dependent protease
MSGVTLCVGCVVNFVLAVGFTFAAKTVPIFAYDFALFALINATVGVFNALPVAYLDGGALLSRYAPRVAKPINTATTIFIALAILCLTVRYGLLTRYVVITVFSVGMGLLLDAE